jgi:hypothetical protein
MPDRRRHRGPHQADHRLFAEEQLPALRAAVGDLSWLLSRGYSDPAALKLVGDRHGLRARQREAVRRAACSDEALALHRRGRVALEAGVLAFRPVLVDGFNCIVTLEAALSGAVVLLCRDGWHRDISSVHGSYRRVEETQAAVTMLGEALHRAGAGPTTWLLDRPVSNSGRLGRLIETTAQSQGWRWSVELLNDPDRRLSDGDVLVATSDGGVLDASGPSIDLPGAVIDSAVPKARLVDLRAED